MIKSPFSEVSTNNLFIAKVLLHNLVARMLTGLKNSTTHAERDAVLMCQKAMEQEIKDRGEAGESKPESSSPIADEHNVSSAKQ